MTEKIFSKKRGKVKEQAVFLFIIIAALPALALGSGALLLINTVHDREISSLEGQFLLEKKQVVESFFSEISGELQIKADDVSLPEKVLSASNWQDNFASAMLKENTDLLEVSFINLEGREVAKRARKYDTSDLLNVSELPKFKVAKNGEVYIGEVNFTLDGPVITVSAPAKFKDKVFQVVSAQVSLKNLFSKISADNFGGTGYALLFNSGGEFLSGSASGGLSPGDSVDWARLDGIRDGKISMETSSGRYLNRAGTKVVGEGELLKDLGWIIISEWPIVDADAAFLGVRDQFMLVTLITIISGIILALIFASRLVRPIRVLKKAAENIAQGDFDKKVEIKSNDEFEDLGEAFNMMSSGLKQLEELKNEFVFIAAHEIRTPVTAIKGYLSMVLEGSAGELSSTLKEYISKVARANERLANLVNDLLQIARSEAGKLLIAVSAGDVEPIIQSIIDEISPLARGKNISLEYTSLKNLPRVMFDPDRLKEVLVNLISNAIKYNNRGGFVKIRHEVRAGEIVTIVQDNGFGISAEDQKRMFEKFFRAEESRVRGATGTGLGMFITKEIVEKMGGKIWFSSELNKGTKFSFTLKKA